MYNNQNQQGGYGQAPMVGNQQGQMAPQGNQMMPNQHPSAQQQHMGQQGGGYVPQGQSGMAPQGQPMPHGNPNVPMNPQMQPPYGQQPMGHPNMMQPHMMPQQGGMPASGNGSKVFIIDDGGDGVLDDSDMTFVNNTTIYVIAMPLSSTGIGVQYGALNVENGVMMASDTVQPTIFTKAENVARTLDSLNQQRNTIFTQQFYQMNKVEMESEPVVIELEYGYKMKRTNQPGGLQNNNEGVRLQKILALLSPDQRQFLFRMAAQGKVK